MHYAGMKPGCSRTSSCLPSHWSHRVEHPHNHITASRFVLPPCPFEITNIRCVSSLLQMFSLTQHQFFQLNPGLGMSIKRGAVVCVRGLTDVSTHAMSAFWPVAIGGALAVAGIAAAAYAKISSSRHQHAGTGS